MSTAPPDAPTLDAANLASKAKPSPAARFVMGAVNALASLRLTVFLFVLALVLVFTGTLAQMDANIFSVVDRYFWSSFVWIPATVFVRFGQVFFGVSADYAPPSWAGFWFPGGWLLGCVMLVNLVSAHLMRFRAAQTYREIKKGYAEGHGRRTLLNVVLRRGGTWAIHLGLILLFVGEYGTRVGQVEQKMMIPEGTAVDYTQDSRLTELAFVTPVDGETERVTVVPQALLRRARASGTRVSDEQLPYDIAVNEWYPNSDIPTGPDGNFLPGQSDGVTAGLGLRYALESVKPTTGVDADQRVDMPGAVVTFYEKGTDTAVGTYAISLWFSTRSAQQLPNTDTRVQLQFVRYFKPFAIELLKFTAEYYPGTTTPKHYESRVRVIDRERDEDFETKISMNRPLRHRGETFFQSSFELAHGKRNLPVDETILQVVKNPVWWVPYAACGTVTLGMLLHFGYFLTQFLVRIARGTSPGGKPVVAPARRGANFLDPVAKRTGRTDTLRAPRPSAGKLAGTAVLIGLTILMYFCGYEMRKAPRAALDLSRLESLPVLDGGRVKPLDTPARVWVRQISNGESVKDGSGKQRPATEWVMELASRPIDSAEPSWALSADVFRVVDPDVQAMLSLERREGMRYSFKELTGTTPAGKGRVKILQDVTGKARDLPASQLDMVQKASLELARHLSIAFAIQNGDAFSVLPPVAEGGELRKPFMVTGPLLMAANDAGKAATIRVLADRFPHAQTADDLRASIQALPADERERFITTASDAGQRANVATLQAGLDADPGAKAWAAVLDAYRDKDQTKFNAALAAFRELQTPAVSPGDRFKCKAEAWLNAVAPFYYVIVGSAIAVGLVLAAWALLFVSPSTGEAFRREAVILLIGLFAVQTVALILRMYLSDRPLVFVTNLYSSAVFIAWGGMLLGLILEFVYPIGVGGLVAAVLGFVGNIIAHNLAYGGSDTIEMQVAVLNDNLWLSTHVTTVTAGYAATFVAGAIGCVYVLLDLAGVFSRQAGLGTGPLKWPTVMGRGDGARELEVGRAIGMLLYGVVCFATMLSFVGTVLGGIWADQSWGRFWGWDPKENGAVLIVIWNALILHARWAGLVKDRGVALLTLVGTMITAWSWFGTNQLGVGLHNYGFSKELAAGCVAVWTSHLFLIGGALGVFALDRVMGRRAA